MKSYRYILLDWDGNIAQTLHLWLEGYRKPFEKRGLFLSDQEIAAIFADVEDGLAVHGIYDADAVIEEALEEVRHLFPQAAIYPDALEVLEELHGRGKKLAIVTSSHRVNLENVLQKYNLDQLFEVIVTGEDTAAYKPDPSPLLLALTKLGGTLGDAVMIGDSASDIKAANAAGIDSILFYPPEHKKYYHLSSLHEHKPTHTVTDFRKILEIV